MPIMFFSRSPDCDWLSNFSAHPFELNGIIWPTVEHYYQAAKYPDQDVVETIRRSVSPAEARSRGQSRSLTPRADWKEVKTEVMRQAVEKKFSKNTELRGKLFATGDEELIHVSPNDKFWGQTKDGSGENWLGKILMEVRQALRHAA